MVRRILALHAEGAHLRYAGIVRCYKILHAPEDATLFPLECNHTVLLCCCMQRSEPAQKWQQMSAGAVLFLSKRLESRPTLKVVSKMLCLQRLRSEPPLKAGSPFVCAACLPCIGAPLQYELWLPLCQGIQLPLELWLVDVEKSFEACVAGRHYMCHGLSSVCNSTSVMSGLAYSDIPKSKASRKAMAVCAWSAQDSTEAGWAAQGVVLLPSQKERTSLASGCCK